MLPLELAGKRKSRDRARSILALVGLENRLKHYPNQLSGGEQQRVAIARAFALDPDILFADEPTGNLDRRTGAQIAELMFEMNSSKRTTLVLVTHDRNLAEKCSRAVELEQGRAIPIDD